MKNLVLVISNAGDEHSREVMHHLERKRKRVALFDISEFPSNALMFQACGPFEQEGSSHLYIGDQIVDFASCQSIWWRRPSVPGLEQVIAANEARFAALECEEALAGLWESLDVRWVNPPLRDEIAGRKAFQLKEAMAVGLNIPKTIITNDAEKAYEFIESVQPARVVFKGFRGTKRHWRETRLVTDRELAHLDKVRHAPVIFQEYIEGGLDVRVTIVGEQLFPCLINSGDTDFEFDFRVSIDEAVVEETNLPLEIEEKLRMLIARFGLIYGAVDMRLTKDGQYVFLELNPSGQWLFIEQRTGQRISEAVAGVLAGN